MNEKFLKEEMFSITLTKKEKNLLEKNYKLILNLIEKQIVLGFLIFLFYPVLVIFSLIFFLMLSKENIEYFIKALDFIKVLKLIDLGFLGVFIFGEISFFLSYWQMQIMSKKFNIKINLEKLELLKKDFSYSTNIYLLFFTIHLLFLLFLK